MGLISPLKLFKCLCSEVFALKRPLRGSVTPSYWCSSASCTQLSITSPAAAPDFMDPVPPVVSVTPGLLASPCLFLLPHLVPLCFPPPLSPSSAEHPRYARCPACVGSERTCEAISFRGRRYVLLHVWIRCLGVYFKPQRSRFKLRRAYSTVNVA